MALQWLSLIGAVWLQSINGANANFPAYSSELKRLLAISQLQLNNLASASDAAKLLGWLSGVAAARLPLPVVLLVAALLAAVGYGLQFLFLTGCLPQPSYPVVFLLTVIAGNSICWINTVSYIVAISNFPLDRHVAVGLSSSYVGLSAKLYTDVVDVVVAPSSASGRAKAFLAVNALLPALVCVAAAPLARVVPVVQTRKLDRGFLAMFVITIITGLFAVCTSLNFKVPPKYAILLGMVALLLAPLVIPLYENLRERFQQKCLIRVHPTNTNAISSMENGDKSHEHVVTKDDCIEEVGAMAMLGQPDFWLYYFVYLFGATLGLVYLNNLGQIAESRGCSGTSSLVSLSSAFTFFGRLLPSLLDYISPKGRIGLLSGGGAMGTIMVPMCGAFFLLLNRDTLFLYISTAVIGVCTGAITSISVSTTAELFGVKNFGVNHNILVSNIPIGTFLFGDFAALLYKRGSNVNGVTSDEGKCIGQICYQTTFTIWGWLCALGVFLAFVLHARTKRKLYANNRL